MEYVNQFVRWFSGGECQYMPSAHCMMGDTLWITITISVCMINLIGYLIISAYWRNAAKTLHGSPAALALSHLHWIFVYCGICGYFFVVIRMFWPAWRLFDIMMVILIYYTYSFIFGKKNIKVVYQELEYVQNAKVEVLAAKESETAALREKTIIENELKQRRFFLNAISHDLRTPLNSIFLNAQLAESAQLDKDTLEAVQTILESSRAATALLDQILDFARFGVEEVVLTKVHFGEVFSKLKTMFSAHANRKGIYLNVEKCDTEIVVDRSRLTRILTNLVDNAIKFTESGGVKVSCFDEGDDTVIVVEDTGSGISDENAAMLFKEFFQVNNYERDRAKGFGMGLAVARTLARQIGGDINLVRNKPGCKFEVRFSKTKNNTIS